MTFSNDVTVCSCGIFLETNLGKFVVILRTLLGNVCLYESVLHNTSERVQIIRLNWLVFKNTVRTAQ